MLTGRKNRLRLIDAKSHSLGRAKQLIIITFEKSLEFVDDKPVLKWPKQQSQFEVALIRSSSFRNDGRSGITEAPIESSVKRYFSADRPPTNNETSSLV